MTGIGRQTTSQRMIILGEARLLQRDCFLRDVEHVAVVAFVAAVQQVDDRERELDFHGKRDHFGAFFGEAVRV